MNEFIEKNSKLVLGVGVLLGLFLLATTAVKMKEYRFVGSGVSATNTITVTGVGKINRNPDTAKISFSISEEKKEVKVAQDLVSKKVDIVTKDLKALGVDEKYIKTDSYSSYPQYDYSTYCYNCPKPSAPVFRGYQVTHSITVSVKDLDKVADVLGVLGKGAVTNLSGPNFGFEDDKAVSREARDIAIADAKVEAQKLSSSLGVRLVRIVSFSENRGGYPMPIYSRAEMAGTMSKDSMPPALPIGETQIESNVTLVYEIQ